MALKLELLAVHDVHHKEQCQLHETWISKAHLGLRINFASELEAMLLSIGDNVSPMVALINVCELNCS